MANKRVNVWDAVLTNNEDVEKFVRVHLEKMRQRNNIDPAMLVIIVDLNRVGNVSSTGRTLTVAQTAGFNEPIYQRDEDGFQVKRDEFFSFHVMRPVPEGAKKKK